MKYFLSLCMLVSAVMAFAQNANISVYSNKGLKFTVVLNGVDQNDQPATHVKITNVTAASYRLKVRFENEKLGQASRGMFVDDGKEYKMAVMHKSVASVDHHFDGVQSSMSKALGNDPNARANNYDGVESYVIRFVSESTASENASKDEVVVKFKPRTRFSNDVHQLNESSGGGSVKASASSGSVQAVPAAEKSAEVAVAPAGEIVALEAKPAAVAHSACSSAMDENTFSATKSGVSSQPTPESKLQVAKQIINAVCMSVEQISGVMQILAADEAKLDYAKYAYDYAFDPQNYASLAALFELTSSVDDFNQFIASKK